MELISNAYHSLYKKNFVGIRFFSVYGPWCRPDMAIPIFINNILNRKTLIVFNNGKIKRDFTYIDDIVIGTRSAIDKNYKCEIFNLGNNKSVDLLKVIKLIESELGLKAVIRYENSEPGDMIETFSDNKYSYNKIGYKPKTKINSGISEVIKWYKEYYKY